MTTSILLPGLEIVAPASLNMVAIEIAELIQEIDQKRYALGKAVKDKVGRSSLDRMERLLNRKISNVEKIISENPAIRVYSLWYQ